MTPESRTPPVNPFAAAAAPANTPAPVATPVTDSSSTAPGTAHEAPAPAPKPVAEPNPEPDENETEEVMPDDPLADDDEALDLEEDGDTFWLVQRILWGLLKTITVVALLGGLAWIIWGKASPKKHNDPIATTPVTEAPAPESERKKDTKKYTKNDLIPAVSNTPRPATVTAPVTTPDDGSVIAASWNIWLEADRIRGQHETPGEALLWAKDVESLFETPFAQAIRGTNSVVRAQKVDRLRRTISDLYARGTKHSRELTTEYAEYGRRAAYEKQVSQTNEAAFLAALDRRDPTGLDQFLKAKIQAEKKYTELAMQAEARAILMEKLGGYMPILTNVDTVLHVNRDAIVQDIRVVDFTGDPFGRVIDLSTWQQANQ